MSRELNYIHLPEHELTVDAVDAYDIFEYGRARVWRFPMEENAIRLDARKRHDRRNGHFQSEEGDQLFHRL